MNVRRRAGLAAGLALVAWLSPRTSGAKPCEIDPAIGKAPVTSGQQASERLDFIETSLEDGARRSRIWAAFWGSAYGLSAVTLFTVAPLVNPELRKDLYVGATSSSIGVLTRLLSRPRVIREHRRLARRIGRDGRTCETLQEAERALVRSAKWERRGRSMLIHGGAIVYNVGVGLVLGLAFDRPLSGIRQAATGMTVGQIMIITQPTRSVTALQRYQRGTLLPPTRGVVIAPLSLRGGGGLTVGGRF